MDDGLPPRAPRLLRWILPAGFVCRVVEPAYDDLLADSIERGQTEVGLPATAQFVLACLWTAFPQSILGSRRSRILATALAATMVVLVIVRLRMDYGAQSSTIQRDRLLPRRERAR